MNRMQMEQAIGQGIALLEMLADQLTTTLEESDYPAAGHILAGVFGLKDITVSGLLEVIKQLPKLDAPEVAK